MNEYAKAGLIELTADVVAAHVSNNAISVTDVPGLIQSVHEAFARLAGGASASGAAPEEKPTAATTVRKSLASPEAIISMIDGKPYKSLKRHIGKHGYTPESYREAFSLPVSYPMVAPAYSERRREVAKALGLGRKPGSGRGTKTPSRAR